MLRQGGKKQKKMSWFPFRGEREKKITTAAENERLGDIHSIYVFNSQWH